MGCCPDTDIDPLKLESAEKKKTGLLELLMDLSNRKVPDSNLNFDPWDFHFLSALILCSHYSCFKY